MGYPHKPHAKETVVLSKYFGEADARTYKGWVKRGGYEMLTQALKTEPARIIDVVKESGLRGRGGAGFPTGLKWSFMPKEKKKPHYLCVNADESEPGTFKDREIMRWTPHALLEGAAIAAHAIQAEVVYVYIRGEFTEPWAVMEKALAEASAAGAFGTLKLHRIEAACIPANVASVRLLERTGFKREGFARQYLCIDGAWQDHLLYARIKDDPSP